MSHDTRRVLDAICNIEWAILPSMLMTIIDIAQRTNEIPEAVITQAGSKLKSEQSFSNRDGIAVVPVLGPIFRYGNVFTQVSGATSIDVLAKDFNAAVRSAEVSAIVLEIDSPGGMVAGTSEFAEQVREATRIKPVVAYVSDLGASAAYWIASAASEMVIRDTARVGSVGVALRAMRDDEDPKTVKIISSQSPLKQASASTDVGLRQYQATVDRLASVFIERVADYRGVAVEAVLSDFGRGGVLVGSDAVAAKMADRLGSLEGEIAKLAAKRKPKSASAPTSTPGPAKAAPVPPRSVAQARSQYIDLRDLPGKSRRDAMLWADEAWNASSEIRAEFRTARRFTDYCCRIAEQAPEQR